MNQLLSSDDGSETSITTLVVYRVIPDRAKRLVVEYGVDYPVTLIDPVVQFTVHQSFRDAILRHGSTGLNRLAQEQESEIRNTLGRQFSAYGIEIEKFLVLDVNVEEFG